MIRFTTISYHQRLRTVRSYRNKEILAGFEIESRVATKFKIHYLNNTSVVLGVVLV